MNYNYYHINTFTEDGFEKLHPPKEFIELQD